MQTTLSSTGEEAYGLVELGTTIGTNALDPIDADGDGDQELVLYTHDADGGPAASGSSRSSSTCATGLLVQAAAEDPDAARPRRRPVEPGRRRPSTTTWCTSRPTGSRTARWSRRRSVNAFAARQHDPAPARDLRGRHASSGRLDDDGVLRPGEAGLPGAVVPEARTTVRSRPPPTTCPTSRPSRRTTIGVGEEVALEDGGLGYRARLEAAGGRRVLVVDGPGADGHRAFALDVPDPQAPRGAARATWSSPTVRPCSSRRRRTRRAMQVRRADRRPGRTGRPGPVGEIASAPATTRRTRLPHVAHRQRRRW